MTERNPLTAIWMVYLSQAPRSRHHARIREYAERRGLDPARVEEMLAALKVTRLPEMLEAIDDWARFQATTNL